MHFYSLGGNFFTSLQDARAKELFLFQWYPVKKGGDVNRANSSIQLVEPNPALVLAPQMACGPMAHQVAPRRIPVDSSTTVVVEHETQSPTDLSWTTRIGKLGGVPVRNSHVLIDQSGRFAVRIRHEEQQMLGHCRDRPFSFTSKGQFAKPAVCLAGNVAPHRASLTCTT